MTTKKLMRTGFTTGACASAAAKAATKALIEQKRISDIEITLPISRKQRFGVHECYFSKEEATAVVIKDAGDDPDCTHGAHLTATVSWIDNPGIVRLDRGAGVGIVTKPGLGLEIGAPAITSVPRKYINLMVEEAAGNLLKDQGFKVIISVPEGEEMAKKTMNARLGILGGICILGTTGIVVPFSTSAYKTFILQSIDVAEAAGLDTLVFTTGGNSEQFMMKHLNLKQEAFIQIGDFIGFSIKSAAQKSIRKVILGGMLGKMSKIAKGDMQTHVQESEVDKDYLSSVALECGANNDVATRIRTANTARHVFEVVTECKIAGFFDLIARKVVESCQAHVRNAITIKCVLLDFSGNIIGRFSGE